MTAILVSGFYHISLKYFCSIITFTFLLCLCKYTQTNAIWKRKDIFHDILQLYALRDMVDMMQWPVVLRPQDISMFLEAKFNEVTIKMKHFVNSHGLGQCFIYIVGVKRKIM